VSTRARLFIRPNSRISEVVLLLYFLFKIFRAGHSDIQQKSSFMYVVSMVTKIELSFMKLFKQLTGVGHNDQYKNQHSEIQHF
jgi:hypothetical protein